MSKSVDRLLPLLVVAMLGCDHTEPFTYTPSPPLGPFQSGVPRQLTFNPGDDRFPSVQGGVVAYAFRAPERSDHDWCVAVLPDTGGQRVHELCPSGPPDGYLDAYRYPAASPDTQRLIFWSERGLVSNSVPATRSLVSVAWAAPGTITPLLDAPYMFPDSTRGNAVRQVTWPAPYTVRFVAGVEAVDLFTTDTIFTAIGVAELDLASKKLRLLPGTDSVATYANAADGGVWVMAADARHVVHIPPGAASMDTVATFPLTVLELANAGGVPVGVAVVISSLGVASPALGYVSPGDSIFHQLMSNATPAGVGANPLSPVIVAPMLRANSGGQLGNLWMVAQ